MASVYHAERPGPAPDPRHDGGFSVIFLVSFTVLLCVALAAQVVGLHWRQWFPGAEGAPSLFSGVKQAVYSFMSYLT
jgi:light-harvesting complex 1 beta chain